MGYLVKNDCCVSLYPAGDKLFTQKCGGALMQIRSNKLENFCEDTIFMNGETKFMFRIADDEYIIGQASGKIYTLKGNTIVPLLQLENANHIPVRIDLYFQVLSLYSSRAIPE